jgi:hypothetical protein
MQSRIPAALAALHNFIQFHNPQANINFIGNDSDHAPGGFYAGDYSLIAPGTGIDVEEEQDISEASIRQNKIADDMWGQYQEILRQRSLAGMVDEESDEDDEGNDDEGSNDNDSDFYA